MNVNDYPSSAAVIEFGVRRTDLWHTPHLTPLNSSMNLKNLAFLKNSLEPSLRALHPWCLKHFSDSRRHLPEAFLNKGKALSGDKRCLRSTSRMMLGMQRRQALAGNMRIDLGRRNIGMPQQKLHGAQISAVVQ